MSEPAEHVVVADAWSQSFPGAVVEVLAMRGVRNPERSTALEDAKERLEEDLRAAADGSGPDDPDRDRVLRAYVDHYRVMGQTHHVKGQWESVALKGKPIPRRAALVEAMFMAELKNLILTAGHDLDAVVLPVRLDVTTEGARYVQLNGKEAVPQGGDMMMFDGAGILASELRGPDREPASRHG